MKKKKTLSTQLTFVISFIVLLIVGVFWMANNTLLEKYYVYNKEKEMLAVYKMVDLAAKNDKLSDDTFAVAFEKKCVGANIDAVVFNKYGKVIIEGTTDNQEIFQLLLEASMSSYSADYNNLNMTRQKDKRQKRTMRLKPDPSGGTRRTSCRAASERSHVWQSRQCHSIRT